MMLKDPFAISSFFFFPFLSTSVLLASTGGKKRPLVKYSDTLLHHEYPFKILTISILFPHNSVPQLVVSATTENIPRQH